MSRVLARDVLEVIVSSFTFLVMGMFFGNLILIILGLFPIIFLAFGLLIGQPREVEINRIGEDLKVWVDEQVGDELTVSVGGGVGVVTVGDRLPKSFRLDEGTNFKVMWKGVRDITPNIVDGYLTPRTYAVQPKPFYVRRIRERKGLTRIPMPMEARIKFGVPTNDFLEIRDYTSGDSYRKINWKATARLLSASPRPFQVNEYEKEGKKVVWIFLDSASHMALGTTVKNTLEFAIQAALGLTQFYLSRECRVGLCVYDYDAYQWEGAFQKVRPLLDLEPALDTLKQLEDPDSAEEEAEAISKLSEEKVPHRRRIIFPDLGRRQRYKIMREMLNVDIKYSDESLREAIHSCRGHIIGTRPLFLIITMIVAAKTKVLLDGIRELPKYSHSRLKPSIIVFNVKGYSVAAQNPEEEIASEVLEFHNRPVYATLSRLGATVLTWNPRKQSFAQALITKRI
jgi:uncharacterized protein (DUF58 family)